jgi:hypothetical protein
MEETPDGTPVGVDDPYEIAGVCDHLTDDGRCRFALAQSGTDPEFAAARQADGYACHVGEAGDWNACPKYRYTTDGRECVRCGLEEIRLAHEDTRPLLEEHHLSYGGDSASHPATGTTHGSGTQSAGQPGGHGKPPIEGVSDSAGSPDSEESSRADPEATGPAGATSHEITASLCRWCHAKIHNSIARVNDDVNPDPEALAAREGRRSKEQAELEFSTATELDDP